MSSLEPHSTLRYAMSLQRDSRFQVIGINQARSNSVGATDADIVFRHRPTGLQARMEVKNMTPASQRADFERLQSQILKMAQDARSTGEVQIWANRQDILPKVRDFAERNGVIVAERLRTGSKSLRSEDLGFVAFANSVDQRFRMQASLNALAGGMQLGMGAYLAYQSAQQLKTEVNIFSGTQADWLRVGEHSSTLLVGGGLTAAGAAQLFRQIPGLANSSRLLLVSRWGGRVGIAGAVLAEGFLLGQYMTGTVTERQFWQGQASLGGGFAGGAAGGYVGFKAGALSGAGIGFAFGGPHGAAIGATIGGTVGAVGGGVGGGYAGAHLAGLGVERLYRLKDINQQEVYALFLVNNYKSP